MKRSELLFIAILVPLDIAMIFSAAMLTYYVRFNTGFSELRPEGHIIDFTLFWKVVLFLLPLFLVIFALNGLYNTKELRSNIDEIFSVFLSVSTAFIAIIALIFLRRELFLSSRFIVLGSLASSVIFVSIGRIITNEFQRFLYRYGIGVHRTVIIGENQASKQIVQEISGNPRSRYKIVSHLPGASDFKIYKSTLDKLIRFPGVDELIHCDWDLPQSEVLKLIHYSKEHKIDFTYAANLYDTRTVNVHTKQIAEIPIIELKNTPLDGWGKITKRIIDIVLSFLLILLFAPLMLLTALIIKLTSKGPILFRKLENGEKLMRVGQFGKLFHYYKFRSMKNNVHSQRYTKLAHMDLRKESPLVKIKNDPRITPFGKFIRRFSIDELPELFLVLKGDMSLVGPRPHFPEEVIKYKKNQRDVLRIKPGITGMGQVLGRSDISFDDEVKLDVYYIENWSLERDFQIMFKTIPAVLRKRKAL